jgi:hypothetical protein
MLKWKTFLRPTCASGDITYISVFSSKKISLEWEIFNCWFLWIIFLKKFQKLSAKENWKSFLAIKKFSRNVVPRIHHYFQVWHAIRQVMLFYGLNNWTTWWTTWCIYLVPSTKATNKHKTSFIPTNYVPTCGFSFATPKPVSFDTAKPLRTHDVIVSGDVLWTCACPEELHNVNMTCLN